MSEKQEYILGTDAVELERLGFQHRVWSADMFKLWNSCGLSQGRSVLDLGCGPGFASFDMAQIVGESGKVVGVDISDNYIRYAQHQAEVRGHTNATFLCSSFDELDLEPDSFDFVYCRWALAWIKNPQEIIQKVTHYLKPGGVFMAQEYLNWGNFRIEPEHPAVRKVIEACREGWRLMPGNIDIGPHLPRIFHAAGLEITAMNPLAKISKPGEMVWQWPATFLHIYSEKLVEMNLLSTADRMEFLRVWPFIEQDPTAVIFTPVMMEIAGKRKPLSKLHFSPYFSIPPPQSHE